MEPSRARCEEEGHRVLLFCSVCEARDQHIKLEHHTVPSASFNTHVPVIDNKSLDELPHSCTVSAPVWRRMKDVIVSHENRLVQLLDAAAHVVSLDGLSRKLTPAIATLIEEFGGFKMTLATMHSIVARERCALEVNVTTVPQAIRNSCRLVVSTISSLFGPNALAELSKALGPSTLLFGSDGTRTDLDRYLNAYINEVVSVSSVGSPAPFNSKDSLYCFCGRSRCDGNVAIHAAVAAYTAASHQLRLRRSFDESLWDRCFSSLKEARRWKSAPISVTIVCVCAAMVELCCEAVHLVGDMKFTTDARDINISCATADAVQSDMFSIVVLALPPTTSSLTTWHCDSKRLVTTASRCQLQLVMTYMEFDSLPDRCTKHRDNVQVILDLQKSAKLQWTWTTMAPDLAWQPQDCNDLWARWIAKFERWCRSTEPLLQAPATSSSSEPVTTTHTSICPSGISYRKHRLLILRYFKWLWRVMMTHDLDVHTWMNEVRCRLQGTRSHEWVAIPSFSGLVAGVRLLAEHSQVAGINVPR